MSQAPPSSGDRSARRLSPRAVAVLAALAAVVLFVGTLMAYGRRQVMDTNAFSARAVSLIHEEPVRRLIAESLTRQAVESGRPDLVTVRPLLESTVSQLISSGTLDPVLRLAAAETHRSLFTEGGSTIVLSLSDALVVAQGIVATARPGTTIPTATTVGDIQVADRQNTTLLRVAERVRWLGVVLPILALLMLGTAIALARDRRRAVVAGGLGIVGAGLLTLLAVAIARPLVLGQFDGQSADVAKAAWDALLGDIGRWALVLVGAGALISASAVAVMPERDGASALSRLRALAGWTPTSAAGQAVRAIVVLLAGVLAIMDPQATIRLVLLAVGAAAVMWGIAELLRLGSPHGEARNDVGALRRRAGVNAARVTAGVGALAVVSLGAVALATGGEGEPLPARPAPCNDHVELCDRRLDQVAMVASHNSMAVARTPGWFNAHHYNPIEDQLDAGVRGLLIDTWLGQQTERNGFGGTKRVRTDLSATSREKLLAEVGPEVLAAAERLSGRLFYGEPVENPSLYLCHGLCEIGATEAVGEFRRIRRWLDEHPDQVVMIVIQDEAATDFNVRAIQAAGLDERAWPKRLSVGEPLPTLRQMIDAGKTAVIMHESPGTEGPDWYQSAYAVTQETPYLFSDVAAISARAGCAQNRGPDDAPLFLLNHWLDDQPVRATQADQVNTRRVLLDRARLCERVRGRMTNLVAVNFVELGDALSVVNTLNKVDDESPQG